MDFFHSLSRRFTLQASQQSAPPVVHKIREYNNRRNLKAPYCSAPSCRHRNNPRSRFCTRHMIAYHRYGHPLGHSVISAASPETKQLARTLLKQVRQHVPLEQLQSLLMSLLEFRSTRERSSLRSRCRVLQEALNTKAFQMTKRILTRLVITAIHLDQYPTPDIRSHRFAYANTLLRTRVQEHRTPKSFPQGAMVALGGQVASAMAPLLSQFVRHSQQIAHQS